MAAPRRRYSCDTAAETLEWMNAIADFLRPLKPILDAHVVNFFKDRLWELVDEQWLECLRREPVENLLNVPSGVVQDYWPLSLQEFVYALRSLVLPREQDLSHPILSDLRLASLGSVLVQGMNLKKKHEVEILAAVVSSIANSVGAQTIVDVGAGQGYLAQALTFEYQLSVVAIDASVHHATVTDARAERIKKHYAAKSHRSQCGNTQLKIPQTVTCRILSSDTLTALSATSLHENNAEKSREIESNLESRSSSLKTNIVVDVGSCNDRYISSSLVLLAGLHACGDLSVNMLRTFVDCEQVKAVVCIGCCYNLLSEECFEETSSSCGFPMSKAAKLSGLILGKNTRDLACQSAERWRSLTKDAALQNFELHTFRAGFQMVLDKHYPEVMKSSPSIGRQGKALRRQQLRRVLESQFGAETSNNFLSIASKEQYDACASDAPLRSRCSFDVGCEGRQLFDRSDKYKLFEEFSKSGLGRLGISLSKDISLIEVWEALEPFTGFVGPFWSLRAAMGPLVETYILLDRLLFLQEQGEMMETLMFPLFDPTLSPRNVAIVARKNNPQFT